MIILLKSAPYASEASLGSLFIGYSVAQQAIPTKVIFLEEGLYNLFPNQNSNNSLEIPPISDLILQFIGLMRFYAVPMANSAGPFSKSWLREKRRILQGIRIIDYSEVVEFLKEDPKNVLII
ncbi:MAG: hypothetical protein DRO88_00765 [Promethearchaeia archaeon]|nr:MAG: hypothetical protein DRO88_00765 [Candidatus Lokiarchaeia archaeon]